MLNLNPEETNRLRNLNNDKGTVEALKKLFLNTIIKLEPNGVNVELRAAERTALEYLKKAFQELNTIKNEERPRTQNDNLV